MTKTEEIRVIISAYTKGYKKEIDSALREAHGFTKNAQGELEASTATWKKYRAAVVREAEAATLGVKKEQEKMRALRDRVSNAATQRADAIAEHGVREGWTDRGIADEIKKEGLGAAVADSDRAAKAYAKAQERLAAYTQQAREAKEALGGLNEKIRESQAAADAEKERAKAALENAKAQAKVQKERERATMGVRRFGLTAMGAMLGARTLYLALRKMVTAISSAMMANAGLNKGLREIKGNLSIAFQGIFQAVLPALQQLVSWLSAATNWLAQFIGALTGVSWSKAKKGAQDYGKAISGAGKAAKGSLAAFDELNVITQQDEAGGAKTDPILSDPDKKFDFPWLDKIKEKVGAFFSEVWQGVKETGAVDRFIAAWNKLKEAISNLAKNPALKKIGEFIEKAAKKLLELVAVIALEASTSLVNMLTDITNILNAVLSGDIAGIINGVKDLLVDSFAAPLALILDIVDAIFGTNTREWLNGIVSAIKEFDLAEWFVDAAKNTKKFFSDLWASISDGAKAAWDGIGKFFTATIPRIVTDIVNWFAELPEKIGYAIGFVIGKLGAWARNAGGWVGTEVPKIIESIVAFFKELPGKIKEKLDTFKEKIVQWKDDTISWFRDTVPQIINSVIDWFAKLPDALKNIGKNMIYGLWNGILSVGNWLWNKIKSFFGAAWDIVQDVFSGFGTGLEAGYASVPRLATGGIVQSDTLARIGENGREAVLPLDRNTGWMERLAGMIGGGDNRDVLLELRTLNQLARALLEKEGNVVFAPSTEAGRWIDRSTAMYELARG